MSSSYAIWPTPGSVYLTTISSRTLDNRYWLVEVEGRRVITNKLITGWIVLPNHLHHRFRQRYPVGCFVGADGHVEFIPR
jgi:hypothetical protein